MRASIVNTILVTLLLLLPAGVCAKPDTPVSPGPGALAAHGRASPGTAISVEVYSTPGCSVCNTLKKKVIPDLSRKHGVAITVVTFSLDDPKNYERLVALEAKYNRVFNSLPVVVIDGKMLGGKKELSENLENLIIEAMGGNDLAPSASSARPGLVKQEVANRIRSLSFLPIVAAALVDGVNPCAFAGMVFLAACLGMINKRPLREVFWTGITYTLGIYVVYFLIGIGLSKVFLAINSLKVVTRVIYLLAGAGTLILSGISFYDWHTLGGTDENSPHKVLLQLPRALKTRIRSFIGKYGDIKYIVPFGFCLGAVVSILEFFCTGQIYLPTIMYMVRIPELKARALFYLSLYSFVFVIPLLIILAMIVAGLKTGRVKVFGTGGTRIIKLSTAIVFLLLSILIFTFA